MRGTRRSGSIADCTGGSVLHAQLDSARDARSHVLGPKPSKNARKPANLGLLTCDRPIGRVKAASGALAWCDSPEANRRTRPHRRGRLPSREASATLPRNWRAHGRFGRVSPFLATVAGTTPRPEGSPNCTGPIGRVSQAPWAAACAQRPTPSSRGGGTVPAPTARNRLPDPFRHAPAHQRVFGPKCSDSGRGPPALQGTQAVKEALRAPAGARHPTSPWGAAGTVLAPEARNRYPTRVVHTPAQLAVFRPFPPLPQASTASWRPVARLPTPPSARMSSRTG